MGADNLVWTAGHCVFDQADGYATSFTFVPDYCNGTLFLDFFSLVLAAGVQYTATSVITNSGWQAGDFSYDYALAKFSGTPFRGTESLLIEH
jgi:hypothetical protein